MARIKKKTLKTVKSVHRFHLHISQQNKVNQYEQYLESNQLLVNIILFPNKIIILSHIVDKLDKHPLPGFPYRAICFTRKELNSVINASFTSCMPRYAMNQIFLHGQNLPVLKTFGTFLQYLILALK